MAERKSAERSRRSVREGLGGRERLSRIGCVQTTKSELCRHKVNPYPGGRTRLSVSPEELPRSILLQAKGTSRTPTVPMQSSRGGTTRPRPVCTHAHASSGRKTARTSQSYRATSCASLCSFVCSRAAQKRAEGRHLYGHMHSRAELDCKFAGIVRIRNSNLKFEKEDALKDNLRRKINERSPGSQSKGKQACMQLDRIQDPSWHSLAWQGCRRCIVCMCRRACSLFFSSSSIQHPPQASHSSRTSLHCRVWPSLRLREVPLGMACSAAKPWTTLRMWFSTTLRRERDRQDKKVAKRKKRGNE
mmetsp:Transcript_49897/g.98339  ORF Transcript_49897/g.98339 Transcript_49897/m.98339 type:complete len:303 (-) Transcript_49897:341-1249(-)